MDHDSSAAPKRPFALRLAQPDFWNKPDPAQDEKWSGEARGEPSATPDWWLLDGPPYANGDVHLGHVLNKCLKDAFSRHAQALGRAPAWRAGWDCHGLPLELAAQKREGAPPRSSPAFLSACRAEAGHWRARQAESFARLGPLADLRAPWSTMDPAREAAALGLLRELWQAGLLVERHSPAHWCPACGSALAASELETASAPKDSLYAWAELDAAGAVWARRLLGLAPAARVGLAYWTTTPWTLQANVAFARPPGSSLSALRLPDGRVALASSSRASTLAALLGAAPLALELDAEALDSVPLRAMSPMDTGRFSPVESAPFARADDGTGFVHVAPAFGPEDFEWAESRPGLAISLLCPMGKDGRYLPDQGPFAGLDRAQAGVLSLSTLRLRGDELAYSRAPGEAQSCWRHGSPVFYRASRQWALDLDKPVAPGESGLRSRAARTLDAMRFLPNDNAKNALARMLEGRRFWTLSRDRPWGLPLPVLRDEQGRVDPSTDAWWREAMAATALGGVEAYAAMRAPDGLTKENQCVDVWFDSGSAFETASEPGFARPDLVVEGADQTRGWFLASMLLGAFRSTAPVFAAVACHGFVVDEKGRKLSKSLGNAPDTHALFEQHGADALRLWSLSQTMGTEVVWSKKSLEAAKGELRDWRNFLRFLLAHAKPGLVRPRNALEHLALSQAEMSRSVWLAAFAKGDPQAALRALSSFRRWASSTWFELSKRTLYCQKPGEDLARLQAQLAATLDLFLPLLDPFMPLSTAQARSVRGLSQHELRALPAALSWDEETAERAREALDWRELAHRELEARRAAAGDSKARFATGDPRGPASAADLGVASEHLVRGVSFDPLVEGWKAHPGWECSRCRGLFPNRELAGGSSRSAAALRVFGAELCGACCEDEEV